MPGISGAMLAGLTTLPWQPQSIRAPAREQMPWRLRGGLMLAVLLVHVLAALVLVRLGASLGEVAPVDAIVVDFIDAPVPPPAPSQNETITIRMPNTPPPARAPPARQRIRSATSLQAMEPPRPLQLFNPDGSLRIPDDMLEQIDRVYGDKRVFSYQVPHMDDAKKYFERNPALVYESTRFDQYWTPDADALTALLTRLVEATTKEVKVKVPGSASSYMVCKVSILAFGGGCGVLTNGADWNGPQDDPNTLNPEENRQCAAWWQQIVGAKTQDVWRSTRKLYERECRKPLLRPPSG